MHTIYTTDTCRRTSCCIYTLSDALQAVTCIVYDWLECNNFSFYASRSTITRSRFSVFWLFEIHQIESYIAWCAPWQSYSSFHNGKFWKEFFFFKVNTHREDDIIQCLIFLKAPLSTINRRALEFYANWFLGRLQSMISGTKRPGLVSLSLPRGTH